MATIAIVDYDMGNLHSVCKGLDVVGGQPTISDRPEELWAADGVVLPGVGSFDPAMEQLRRRGLGTVIQEIIASGKPFLGICLGLQILFQGSEEGTEPGLGVFSGMVKHFQAEPHLTIPHMGWNQLEFSQCNHPCWQNLPPQPWVYFVHSYYVAPEDPQLTAAYVTHGQQRVTAAIAQGNVIASQFHPEKSGPTGLQILKNFVQSLS
ncbi:imidazole glycerol phosphate synthase subunit HisH [Candidatus Synechococcus calcipolaris G9]|uniref:Imidazole glycerol phosphate synthase subunit HisH n=1 Tax=Candidatus Synechococcus calcipolaris G9 TaxID=1497997 RepID=A0ABT6F1D8_9SYNE|nr:imidazole glycerol phosphate synthase subunit HisH [Candidatus Synechococcus calcipolaris]MDG2991675.1 imidazole glycerol phosphate synthase subunit HisH [Candidatus Synechococcus calcipolaris G9]